MIILKQKLRK